MPATQNPPGLPSLVARIQSLKDLPPGWDLGHGVPATGIAVARAIQISRFAFARLLGADATPCTDGGIQVTVGAASEPRDRLLEVTIGPDGALEAMYSRLIDGAWSFVSAKDMETLKEVRDAIIAFGKEMK